MALFAFVGLGESGLAIVTGGNGGVGNEPAWLGSIWAGWAGGLALVPFSGELSLLANAGAAWWDLILRLGGNETSQECANDEKLELMNE